MQDPQVLKPEHIVFDPTDPVEGKIQNLEVVVGLRVKGAHLEALNLVVLQKQLLQLLHLVEGVQGNCADVVVTKIQGGDCLQGLEGDVGQLVKVEGVPEDQLLQ